MPKTRIEEIQRGILARMDESDRRAAEREKEGGQQLAERLAQYGLRPVTQEEMLASFKRFSDTVDRVLQAREAKRKKRRRNK